MGDIHDDGLECRFSVYGSVLAGSGGTTNYTITASAGANGSIAPSGAVSVSSGSNQTFAISGNSGYVVTNVFVDGSAVGASNSYTFVNVTATHTISAYFGAVVVNYTINATAGANGAILPSGAVSVPSGNSQTFTIGGNSGYIVTNVFVDGSAVGASNSYTFVNVTATHTISAYFGVGVMSNSWPCERGPNKDGSTMETVASWPPRSFGEPASGRAIRRSSWVGARSIRWAGPR